MNGGYIPLCPAMCKGDKGSMGVRPLPCVRDEHGAIKEQTVKQLIAKIDEEMNELKAAILEELHLDDYPLNLEANVAEEAADVKTAITTLEEALGIGAAMRDDSQRAVNEKNRERGRI